MTGESHPAELRDRQKNETHVCEVPLPTGIQGCGLGIIDMCPYLVESCDEYVLFALWTCWVCHVYVFFFFKHLVV